MKSCLMCKNNGCRDIQRFEQFFDEEFFRLNKNTQNSRELEKYIYGLADFCVDYKDIENR